MNPAERDLIAGLFQRMRDFGAPEKDREAEALISQAVRANPDAAYMLVQSVLVQEQALQAANNRIIELEERLRDGDAGEPRSRGFLGGGLFGGGDRREARGSGVPQIGSRATPATTQSRSPWTQGSPQAGAPAQPAAAGGGFMQAALATAAGVAGGMLLAEGIRNMMGSAHANPSTTPGTQEGGGERYRDERDNDPGTRDSNIHDADDNDPGFDSGDGGIDI